MSAPSPPDRVRHPNPLVRAWRALFPDSAAFFPGHDEWRTQVRIEAEVIAAPRRLGVILLMAAWWALAPHAAGAQNGPVWTLLATSAVIALVGVLVARVRPTVFTRLPYATAVTDLVLLTLIVRYSGGAGSPFTAVFFLASAGVALRGQPIVGILATFVFPIGLSLATLPGGGGFSALMDFMLTLATTLWSSRVMETRVGSLRDPLTGVVTRSHALFHLEQLSRRATQPFTVGLIDLDHFKAINDTYGHHTGDLVLQQYVRLIESGLRAEDLLARFGGDELLVVWTNLQADEALPIAQRLRSIVEEAQIGLGEGREDTHVTVSIGLFEAKPGMRPAQLLQSVDQCLYMSKRLRNEVTALVADS